MSLSQIFNRTAVAFNSISVRTFQTWCEQQHYCNQWMENDCIRWLRLFQFGLLGLVTQKARLGKGSSPSLQMQFYKNGPSVAQFQWAPTRIDATMRSSTKGVKYFSCSIFPQILSIDYYITRFLWVIRNDCSCWLCKSPCRAWGVLFGRSHFRRGACDFRQTSPLQNIVPWSA